MTIYNFIAFLFFFVSVFGASFFLYQSLRLKMLHKELAKIIQREGYIERFNDKDFRSRQFISISEYISSVRFPNFKEYAIIRKLLKETKNDEPFWISHIPWRFLIFTKGEGGLPHTHGTYIMLPFEALKHNITASTLIHEKIHIFQRLYPIETNKYLNIPITGFVYPEDNMRANPDTNRILFDDYRPLWMDNPSSLLDITDKLDHPYEVMAYKFEMKKSKY